MMIFAAANAGVNLCSLNSPVCSILKQDTGKARFPEELVIHVEEWHISQLSKESFWEVRLECGTLKDSIHIL